MADRRPAFYAATGRAGEWWTVLHPPYTAWHLSYVAIGAAVAPRLDAERLVATLLAFFLAVGIAAHALDELNGRPLRTSIPSSVLAVAAAWGAFPVLTAYVAQAERLTAPALLAAAAAYALSRAQRSLSSSVRFVRRQTNRVDITLDLRDGDERTAHEELLLEPPEAALRALSWGLPVLAAALVVARI